MKFRVGIDVGGTFTDLALLSEAGQLFVHKVPSRPSDIAAACLEGVAGLLEIGHATPGDIEYWSHGSTVATNALVERKGARIALLATEGFRDTLEIRRQIKPDRYNLHKLKPEPVVSRELRLEVRERILWDGSVHVPLDEPQVEELLDRLEELGVEAVAVCFLHAYMQPSHEVAVLRRVREKLPRVFACASHEVLPEFREYPRTSTTVTNAYVGPVVRRYLARFEAGGRELGIEKPLNIFQSNGGIASASGAAELPVKVLFSGPAAGVQGAVHVAKQAGYSHVIAFDMGGTSTDVCLIRDGVPLTTVEKELAGYPVRTPMIDVHSIGAGGGSLAWIDAGGLMQVGPQSAGADPGPAAYGRGGTQATVTDANVVLGRLNPEYLLGGRLKVDTGGARAAVAVVAEQLKMGLEDAALGIVAVVNSNMMGAIRVVSVDRGYDHRDCVLMAFGGAGPLHAAEVAAEMGIKEVLVPPSPGILCAMGLLLADYKSDFTRTRILPAAGDRWQEMREVFAELEERAQAWVVEHGIPSQGAQYHHAVYMRYVGQSFQLAVPAEAMQGPADVEALVDRFHAAHKTAYGYEQPQAVVEVVDFHLTFVVPVPRPKIRQGARQGRGIAQVGERPVWFRGGAVRTPIYRREALAAGDRLTDPAIIEQLDATTMVPPDAEATVDEHGNILIRLG